MPKRTFTKVESFSPLQIVPIHAIMEQKIFVVEFFRSGKLDNITLIPPFELKSFTFVGPDAKKIHRSGNFPHLWDVPIHLILGKKIVWNFLEGKNFPPNRKFSSLYLG